MELKVGFSNPHIFMTKTALFHNFTTKDFVGYWDGKAKRFPAGSKKYMPDYLAMHYAKHLTNSILIEKGEFTSTSPKSPKDVPLFKELFDRACIIEEEDDLNEAEMEIELANKTSPNGPISSNVEEFRTPSKQPQVVLPPEGDDDEEFEDLKNDEK